MFDDRLISADSHFIEPPEMWRERIEKKYHDRAPRIVKGLNGKDATFLVCENIAPVAVTGFIAAGVSPEDLPGYLTKGFEAAPASMRDPAARLKEQDVDGIRAEVLYASCGMPLFALDDSELRAACFRAFNDWAAEYCSHDPKRLLGYGLVSLDDVPAAIDEMERIAKLGLCGAMISTEPGERSYAHPDYEPFWAASEGLGLKLSMHATTGRRGIGFDFARDNIAEKMSLVHHEVERSLAALVFGGVLERHPGLVFVSVENDVGWLPYLMWRMDHAYAKSVSKSDLKWKLEHKPSEYLGRQVYATFTEEPVFLDTLRWYGNGMWSSDYPHALGTWPRSREIVRQTFAGLPPEEAKRIVYGTAARLYGID